MGLHRENQITAYKRVLSYVEYLEDELDKVKPKVELLPAHICFFEDLEYLRSEIATLEELERREEEDD